MMFMGNVGGKFIVIEGTDGSGKGTQFQKLVERFNAQQVSIATFDFPQYGKPSAYFVEKYLKGGYAAAGQNGGLFSVSGAGDIGPYEASVFYAVDRYDVRADMLRVLAEGQTVLANRFVASNMGHQGAKMSKKSDRLKYFKWIEHFEFEILGIPRPNLNIILHVPAVIAQQLVAQKSERKYLEGAKKDIHEKNLEHLKHAEQVYLEIAELFPEQFTVVECVEGGRLLSVEQITAKVWEKVEPLLR